MDTKKLRQKILDLAIRGKLVPQDPNDEPASALLERIRAEKERLIKEGKIKRSKKSASDTPRYENEAPFEVPKGWVWTRLCDITGLIEDCPHSTAKDEGSGFPLIRTPNVGEGYLLLDGVHRVSESVYNKRNARAIPETNDIIYAREAPAGNAAVIKDNEKVCLGQRTVLIRPLKGFVDSKLLAYFIISPYSRSSLISTAVGSTATHVNLENIRPFTIPLPPITEQHRIATAVDEWFSLIKELEQEKEDLQTSITLAKSKILNLAIHGKLVPQDPNDEPAIELLKRINPKFTPCDNAHYENLPNSWCVVPLGNICCLNEGKPISDKEYPYIDVKGLRTGNYASKQSGKYVPAGTTFILVDGENSGEVFHTPVEGFQGSTMKVLEIDSKMNAQYVLYFVKLYQKALRENKVGSAIPHLNKKMFRELIIPIPPKEEQERIVGAIQQHYRILDDISANL